MPIFCSPKKDETPPVAEESIQYPIGRLGAVTRIRNQIEEYLKNVGLNLRSNSKELKALFTEYLVKVENLYDYCNSMNKDSIKLWLEPHKVSIEEFRERINGILYPPPPPPQKTPSVTTRNSKSSTTSSARIKLIEQKAEAELQSLFNEEQQLLEENALKVKESYEQSELNLKLSKQRSELQIKKAERNLQSERARKKIEILERELNDLEVESQCSSIKTVNEQEIPKRTFIATARQSSTLPQNEAPPSLPTALHPPTHSVEYHFPSKYAQFTSPEHARQLPHSQVPASQYDHSLPPLRTLDFHSPLRPHSPESRPAANNLDFNSKIIEVLQNQTELSRSLIRQQERSSLPRKELEVFSGSNLTDFKMFIDKFEHLIEKSCNNEKDKLLYLQQYTSGRARKIVDSCAHSSERIAYQQAKQKLFSEFDNEFKVSNTYLERLSNWPSMKNEDPAAMEELALFLSQCDNYVSHMSIRNPLQSPNEMLMVINKLPYKFRERWRRRSHSIIHNFGTISFKNLVDFVNEESSILNSPLFGNISGTTEYIQKNQAKSKLLFTQSEQGIEESKYCEFCKNKNHYLTTCRSFSPLNSREKSDFIYKARLCFGCLRRNHFSKDCTKRLSCSKCNLQHPTILHSPPRIKSEDCHEDDERVSSKVYSIKSKGSNKIITPIIPVVMKINNREKVINCALDTCATDCWINDKLLKYFDIYPPNSTVSISTMNNINYDMATKVVSNIVLTDLTGNNKVLIPVAYTKSNKTWPFSREDVATEADLREFKHLRDVPLDFIDADVDMLVGMRIPELLKPLEVVCGADDQPYAAKHVLGWCVSGPISRLSNKTMINKVSIKDSIDLNNNIEKLISCDFIDNDSSKCKSVDDQNWLNLVSNTLIKLPNNNLQIDLPLKDNSNFPCNKSQIYSMFLGLKKRLFKNDKLYSDYKEFMQLMIDSRFVEQIPDIDLAKKPGSYWYLNHHPVYHKQKNKIRIVFNCSLEFQGTSLNSNLHQGPDLASSLMGVLLRFRQESVAIVGDISKMFYQVKVPRHHADYMRFFWLNSDGKSVEYRLLVHVFGAKSSPSVANYALKQCTNYTQCTETVNSAVQCNFYVDDFLKSVSSEKECLSIISEVSKVLSQTGFTLTAFNSNSPEILKALPPESLSKDACIHELQDNDETQALGVIWKTGNDKLSFKCNLLSFQVITKRNMLKVLASVFDPLGLLNPVLIHGKRLFQEACRQQISWDDEVSKDIIITWRKWLLEIGKLNFYEVPRCLKLNKNAKKIVLHTFSDGSEKSYGAVCYLSFIYDDHDASSALVTSKSRLTPLNNSTLKTIPRIELAAAKVAVELSAKVKHELEYELDREVYWTDSITVLKYINSNSARFQRYVSNKVNYIRNFTNPLQWKYVPSIQNPADIITRGYSTSKLIDSSLWNHGPNFITNTSLEPKQQTTNLLDPDDIEVKKDKLVLTCITANPDPVDCLMTSCSSWYKLKVRIASVLMFKYAIQHGLSVEREVSLNKIKEAENCIFKYYQNKYYFIEIQCLNKNMNLPQTSSIRKLNPFLDSSNIMRVGGRLTNSAAEYDVKHPIILPPSFLAELVLTEIHKNIGHLGRESMMAKLRTKYWITRANSIAKKITNTCVICKKVQGRTGKQIMADLPKERITGSLPVFANTGTDYFGPFYTKHGRKEEKIYGVIFTCMNSRAIHIELSHNLTTDSFLNALRRFIARRGNVRYMVSDNGTNLTGGNTELKNSIDQWNEGAIDTWMKQRNIEWKFNTPNASHFGGFFEREIRSIRKVFNSVMMEQNVKLTFEELHTLMCEVESTLNSRPLTEISDDCGDLEPLTPNHLLLLNNFATFPPGVFVQEDIYARKRWRQVQYLSNLFWTRWKKEYVVLLQNRQKWIEETTNFAIDDIVLISDVNLPRNNWPLGRIIAVNKDSKNLVRSCSVRISKCKNSSLSGFYTSTVERPITKLVKLCSLL